MPDTPFESGKLSAHVKVLASDAFEWEPASAGEQKTITYIGEQFAALGLEPGGDKGRWTQEVPLRKFEMAQSPKIKLALNGALSDLKNGEEIVVVSLVGQEKVEVKNAPLVFVGYGVTAPELGWDDFKSIDLTGKIAVFLINDPDFESATAGKRPSFLMGRARYPITFHDGLKWIPLRDLDHKIPSGESPVTKPGDSRSVPRVTARSRLFSIPTAHRRRVRSRDSPRTLLSL